MLVAWVGLNVGVGMGSMEVAPLDVRVEVGVEIGVGVGVDVVTLFLLPSWCGVLPTSFPLSLVLAATSTIFSS